MPNLMTRLLAAMPAWERRFNDKFLIDTVGRMNALVAQSPLSRGEIAERAGWKEPYLSRVLSGQQNLTLRSLAKFEAAVDADVLAVTGMDTEPVGLPHMAHVWMRSEASALVRFATSPSMVSAVSEAGYSYARPNRTDCTPETA